MTPDAAGIEAALAAGLAAHEISEPRGYAFVVCTCGSEFGNESTARTHVAAALLPVVTRAQAGALREAAEGVIPDQFRDDPELCPTIYDPWDVADWLLDRADQISNESHEARS